MLEPSRLLRLRRAVAGTAAQTESFAKSNAGAFVLLIAFSVVNWGCGTMPNPVQPSDTTATATSSSTGTANGTANDSTSPPSSGTAGGSGTASDNAAAPTSGTAQENNATIMVTASSTSIAFGSVVVGSSAGQAVTLTNGGNATSTIFSASTSGSDFSASGLTFPVTLAAGASRRVTLTYAPSGSGPARGSVSFVSNSTNSPTTIALSGSGVAPLPHSVALAWQAGTSAGGYNVYRSNTTGGPYARLNTALEPDSSFLDSSVQSGHQYFYVVTVVSSTGMESGYSNEVAAVIPLP